MSRTHWDTPRTRSRVASVGMVFSFAAVTAVLGGSLGGYFFDGKSNADPPPRAIGRMDANAADDLQSLRRSRLAFLNLGFERGSSLIQGIDEEIAVAECSLKTIRASLPLESSALADASDPEGFAGTVRVGWILGSIAGFALGIAGGVAWTRRARTSKRSLPRSARKGARLKIPILGVIPEGAFKNR